MKRLSIVIPAYNEAGNIPKMISTLKEKLSPHGIDYKVYLIDDGSTDNTWQVITENMSPRVCGLRFSRNFGKEAAVFAGLKEADGDAVIVMDCDLQHPVDTVIEMHKIWQKGEYKIIEARKSSRGKESALYKAFAHLFYNLLRLLCGIDIRDFSDFKLMDRQVVDAINSLPERQPFFRAMSGWVGFKTLHIFFDVAERFSGDSKWSTTKLVRYAFNSIAAFSAAPMQIVSACGVIFFLFALIIGADTVAKVITGHTLEGFPTVILLILITGCIIMFSLGIIGYYLANIYTEIKGRPRYIISEKSNSEVGK